MSEQSENTAVASKIRNLDEAIQKVRAAAAEADDVIVDMKEAEKARLEILAQELQGVAKDIPEDDDRFELAVTEGEKPRLWVDLTTQVVMGRDKRTYRLIKDTKLGRTILGETADLDTMADLVVDYVAERMLDRERAMEAEMLLAKAAEVKAADKTQPEPKKKNGSGAFKGFMMFVFGAFAAAGALLGYAFFFNAPPG